MNRTHDGQRQLHQPGCYSSQLCNAVVDPRFSTHVVRDANRLLAESIGRMLSKIFLAR
jgi:hypothetical protein